MNQAKTAAYYAVATYLNLEIMPVLIIIGKAGTGKSSLMHQMARLVSKPQWINVKTIAALRTELSRADSFTALIEEGDRVDEDLITNRYSKATGQIAVRIEAERGWQNTNINIFGATIIHRRIPLSDLALRSRSIIIATEYRPGVYEIQEKSNEEVQQAAKLVGDIPKTSNRVDDTWAPLIAVATALGDQEWLAYAKEQIELNKKSLVAGHSYEPEKALVFTLRALMGEPDGMPVNVLISEIKRQLKYNFDLYLTSYQIEEMCVSLGFKVTHPSGYPTVQSNSELLGNLIVKHSIE
jgi:energy-coupling factor transporter ATP-binding protein EcfA2